MCIFSQPKAPPPVVVPDPPNPLTIQQPAAAPQASDQAVQQQRTEDRQRRLRATQANDTLVTGGAGLTSQPATGLKTAYGQ